MGGLFESVLSTQESGSLGLSLVTQPPGLATPLHRHTTSTEAFLLIEGTMTYQAGEETFHLGAGDFIWLPKQLPHAFRVTGATPVRFLGLVDPGDLFGLYDEVGRPATERALPGPDPALLAEEVAHWLQLAPQYGIEVVGPPLAPDT
jgi:quercetin dioxygenase-like cupin family protein